MQNHLTDLDELLEGVRNSRSRDYISEAIRSYRAGAYRAAIITTWVAVCIDIIEKIRELSHQGDTKAKKLEDDLNKNTYKNINAFLNYEKTLLKHARDDLKIISNQEVKFLQRIKDDRNFCAHPDFLNEGQGEQITAEGARNHIVNACNALLHHPPIMGKILIKKIQTRVGQDIFPTNPEEALTRLESEYYLGSAQDFVSRELTNNFLEQIFQEGDKLPNLIEARVFAALHAISRLKTSVYKIALEKKLNALLFNLDGERLKRVFLLPRFLLLDLWSSIKDANRVKINDLISMLSIEDIIEYKLFTFIETISEFKPTLEEKYANLSDDDKLKIIAVFHLREFKNLAIQTFIASGNYDIARTNGQKYLLPYASYFDIDDLQNILNASSQNSQILPSWGMEDTFISLFNETKQTIPEYSDIWLGFWNTIRPRYGQSLNILSAHLTAEGVIPAQTQNTDDGQGIDLA